jgi:hypothetical protein
VTWDGKNDEGTVVSSGHYEIEVHYRDGHGGDETVSLGVVVQGNGDGMGAGVVYAGPNHLQGGETVTTVRENGSRNLSFEVKVYNVAGERVSARTTQATGGTQVDFKGLADGLYFLVTDIRDGNGKYLGKRILKVVYRQ